MPNKSVVNYLERLSIHNASFIVARLIEGGYIEDIKMTEPELLVEGAKRWLGNYGIATADTFNKVSGWSNDSWKIVMDDFSDKEYDFNTPWEVKRIFEALVILAKEAGIL